MKLCTFSVHTPVGKCRRIGVVREFGIVDATAARVALLERSLTEATAVRVGTAQVPPDMTQVIGGGPVVLDWVSEAVDAVMTSGDEATTDGQRTLYQDADVELLAPVPRPPGVSNFSAWPDHIKEAAGKGFNLGVPDAALGPQSYWKGNPDSVAGPGAVLEYPAYADELDVECEVAAIIGVGGKDLTIESAEKAIAGYCIFNDVSIRDAQRREMVFGRGPAKGKDHDGGNILGPWLVTSDEVGDPKSLWMALVVNGEEWSSHSAASMAFSYPQLVAYLSQGQTLRPGHVVSAGNYPGGSAMDLGKTLHDGDLIELCVSRLGALVNRIGRKARE